MNGPLGPLFVQKTFERKRKKSIKPIEIAVPVETKKEVNALQIASYSNPALRIQNSLLLLRDDRKTE